MLCVSERARPLPVPTPGGPGRAGSGKGGSPTCLSRHAAAGGQWTGGRTVRRGSQGRGSSVWGSPWEDRRDPPRSEMNFAEGRSPQAALLRGDVCDLLRRKTQNLG